MLSVPCAQLWGRGTRKPPNTLGTQSKVTPHLWVPGEAGNPAEVPHRPGGVRTEMVAWPIQGGSRHPECLVIPEKMKGHPKHPLVNGLGVGKEELVIWRTLKVRVRGSGVS